MREEDFSVSSLENAIKRLGEILVRYQKDTNDDGIRDSVIQRFEFTYSIALKTLSKYLLKRSISTDEIKQMSFNELIRTANQLDLLKSDLILWTEFREMRNMTSHTYDEEIALQVVEIVPKFYEEVLFLVNKLK